jgi:hypothetical protein
MASLNSPQVTKNRYRALFAAKKFVEVFNVGVLASSRTHKLSWRVMPPLKNFTHLFGAHLRTMIIEAIMPKNIINAGIVRVPNAPPVADAN